MSLYTASDANNVLRAVIITLLWLVIHFRNLIPKNDIERIITRWGTPGSMTEAQAKWPADFSRDITPIACHSHNDYWRRVPLYDALAVGCTSVEADIWLQSSELLVGHSSKSLTTSRTLKSLYLDPLVSILAHQNPGMLLASSNESSLMNGVFSTSPNTSLTLLIDIKTDGPATLPVLLDQLEPLRSQGLLTYFNNSTIIPAPVTIVGTGNTPFDILVSNTTYRDIFFDAPLDQLWGEDAPSTATVYTTENSYYASVSFSAAIGKTWLGGLTPQQVQTIRGQIRGAKERGLRARYWDTPKWPRGLKEHVWNILEKEGVGILSVDDLQAVKSF